MHQAVKMLLQLGADPLIKSSSGKNAIEFCNQVIFYLSKSCYLLTIDLNQHNGGDSYMIQVPNMHFFIMLFLTFLSHCCNFVAFAASSIGRATPRSAVKGTLERQSKCLHAFAGKRRGGASGASVGCA